MTARRTDSALSPWSHADHPPLARTITVVLDLEDALEDQKAPLENRPLIRAFVASIGCSRFEATTTYIKATRIHGGPDLQIGYGWTTGFRHPRRG